jgi:hypothetical protein
MWLGAVVLAVLTAVTLFWFQLQKLLYDHPVHEPLPSAAAPSQAPGSAAAPVELASGPFVSGEHETRGTARVLRLADGSVVVRFEGFATSNGPLLVVRLSTNPADGPDAASTDGHVDLGPLRGNVGDQNYVVPAGVDTTAYTSVVVWCARFHVAFGAADLTPVSPRRPAG